MVLDSIPFQVNVDELIKQLRLDPTDDFCVEVRDLAAKAALVARPKALIREAFVTKRGKTQSKSKV
jgi:hypothetical protein